jgi:hypothetical protein
MSAAAHACAADRDSTSHAAAAAETAEGLAVTMQRHGGLLGRCAGLLTTACAAPWALRSVAGFDPLYLTNNQYVCSRCRTL